MGEQPKVFEYAKEIGMETLVLMDKIRGWKLPVKSHMAALGEDVITEIQTRLDEESGAGKKTKKKKAVTKKKAAAKKKTTKKKTTKKKTAAPQKKVVKKKTVAKKSTTKKVTAKKTAAQKTTTTQEVAEKPVVKRTVIRRRAGEVGTTPNNQTATTEVPPSTTSEEGLSPSPSEASPIGSVATTSEAEAAETKLRGNIVGRMDLNRVQTSQSGTGAAASPRPQRTVNRNIRTGFVAMPMDVLTPVEVERREKEKVAKKKPAAGSGGKEQPVQTFAATEFRKREVIFQPKKKRSIVKEGKKTQLTTPKASKRIVRIHDVITVAELAKQLGVKAPRLSRKLMAEGVMAQINTELDFDTVSLIVPEFGFEAQNLYVNVDEKVDRMAFGDVEATPVTRPPVVTVMGHVDHGKTTLLDAIRSADVVSSEAGGITQHIGAYRVTLADGKVATFIDTPGHAAFTEMRARGANVTDIVIIVVAADDGVMPQTEEAINHAKAAGVPIIVAINKIDRPDANTEKIKQQLMEYELIPEEWGGTTLFVEVSALKREGIESLIEQIHLVAEVQEIKSNPKRSATGIVIESSVKKGSGNVATLLVREGTLKLGDCLVAGLVVGRVRRMNSETGTAFKEVGPGIPVEVTGLEKTPDAGDRFDVCRDEYLAREVAEQRIAEAQKKIGNTDLSDVS